MSPDDPQLTSAAQDLWVRSYVEERWRLTGQDPEHLPKVLLQLVWSEVHILIAVNINSSDAGDGILCVANIVAMTTLLHYQCTMLRFPISIKCLFYMR